MSTRIHLAESARSEALQCFHGFVMTAESNLTPIITSFPGWSLREADGLWCAAFVYYCCQKAGFHFPIRPIAGLSCNLAGCLAWEEWAQRDSRLEYHPAGELSFQPEAGDIALFDNVFVPAEHDHIGIILENREDFLITAEGNVNNLSAVLTRPRDHHIRAYIRIPNHFSYNRARQTRGICNFQVQHLALASILC